MRVSVDLSNRGVWESYGVFTFGQHNYFILTNKEHEPAGFSYSFDSGTGYGGILLIMGQNPATGTPAPLVYDLSCPVERLPNVRVRVINSDLYEAVCPDCGSHYNVVDGVGNAVSGPALEMDYGLTPYQCYPTTYGGYIITN